MSFFLLKIDPNYVHLSELLFMLGSTPNGNVLGSSRAIFSPSLKGFTRIYWIDEWSITEHNINLVREFGGVTCFEKVDGIPVTIYDPEWRYEDDYIENLFLPIINKKIWGGSSQKYAGCTLYFCAECDEITAPSDGNCRTRVGRQTTYKHDEQ